MKKPICLLLVFLSLVTMIAPCLAQDANPVMLHNDSKYTIKGSAQINRNKPLDPNLFTGAKTEVKKGTKLKMAVSTIISTTYAEEEDQFFAQITNDVSTKDGVIIPAGSFAHGIITDTKEARRLGRNAYVSLDFDYIITPDGRKIPIEASMTTKANPVKAVAKHVAKDTGYMLGGGAMGGWMALNMLGLPAAIATHGGTVAGGAGIGAVAGLGIALSQKGKEILITPGDEIKVKMKSSLELPIMRTEAFKEDEILSDDLDVEIYNVKVEKDPFGEPNVITLSVLISNQTKKAISIFDMALVNDIKNIFYPSPFNNTDFWFSKINPGDRISTKISFSVNNPRRKYWLVIRDNYTRKPIVKLSLDNAKREISNNKKCGRKHKKDENNFYVKTK